MCIHLSKHVLGWTEKSALELSGRVDATVEMVSARDRISRKIETIRERLSAQLDAIADAAGATRALGDNVDRRANGAGAGPGLPVLAGVAKPNGHGGA
jgi:hypothetical protein